MKEKERDRAREKERKNDRERVREIYIYIYIYISKLAYIVKGDPNAPFSIATTPRCRGGSYSFFGLLYFTLDPYLIMLSVKQGGIKYHFLSLWSPGPLANTLTAKPMSGIYIYTHIYI